MIHYDPKLKKTFARHINVKRFVLGAGGIECILKYDCEGLDRDTVRIFGKSDNHQWDVGRSLGGNHINLFRIPVNGLWG